MLLQKGDAKELLAAIFKYSDTEILCRSSQQKEYSYVWIIERKGELAFSVRLAKSAQELRAAEREIEELLKETPCSIAEKEPPPHSAASKMLYHLPTPNGQPKIYVLAAEEVEKMISSSSPPEVQKLYSKLLLIQEIEKTIPENYQDQRWAAGMWSRSNIEGIYFPTKNLQYITDYSHVFRAVNPDILANTLIDKFKENPDLLPAAIKAIQDFGFRRLSFVNRGSSTYAFKGVRDEEDRGQFILISPSEDEYIPHPLILSATKSQLIDDGSLRVRVMPEVEILTEDDPRIDDLIEKIEACGLMINIGDSGLEIRPYNIGIYTYIDESGKTESVAMILDWGAVSWPPRITPEEKEAMIRQWESDPAFEPWRKAKRHMDKPVQNVYDGKQLAILSEATSELLPSALESGLYPREIGVLSNIAIGVAKMERAELLTLSETAFDQENILGELSKTAAQAALKGNADYHKLLRVLVDKYNKSYSPSVLIFRD